MQPAQQSAPADLLHIQRSRLSELNTTLTALRKTLPLMHRLVSGAQHGFISASAALLAYLPTRAFGLNEGFWSAITAISVVQTEFLATKTTARDQFIGAMIGGCIGVCASLAFGQQLLVYAAAIVLSMSVCSALNVASSSRLSAVTATIILLVPHTGSPARMFGSRITEVGWGVCVAVATVWLAARLPAQRWGLAHTSKDAGTGPH